MEMNLFNICWSDFVYYDGSSPTCLRWKNVVSYKKYAKPKLEGEVAGKFDEFVGYARLQLHGKSFLVHRIIMVLFNKLNDTSSHVDHLDRDVHNNKVGNLRVVRPEENMRNKSKYKNNNTGITGIGYRFIKKGKHGYWYYVAYWKTLDGKDVSAAFSCNKYGEDEAKRMAIERRTFEIEKLNAQLNITYTENHGE